MNWMTIDQPDHHQGAALGITLAAMTMLMLVAPREASAQKSKELIVEASVNTRYAYDRSLDVVSDDNLITQPRLTLGVGGLLGTDLRLYLSAQGARQSAVRRFDTFDLTWGQGLFMLEADWGPRLWRVLRPSIRVGTGYSRQYLSVRGEDQIEYVDRAHALVARGGGALEISTPMTQKPDPFSSAFADNFSLGAILFVGYMWQTRAEFSELRASRSEYEPDEDVEYPWSHAYQSFGALDARGWFWSLGAQLRYRF